MADVVSLLAPKQLNPNPENPRLIFHADELEALKDSIAFQGILVPLTVYKDKNEYYLLDGERRWRCALKLGLSQVPVIIQPKPDRMTNLMMMFAIHNARKDWDPLPTALKLEQLEKEFTKRNGRPPSESELAGLASVRRGEVRRLKKLLNLPTSYRQMLLKELEKPRAKQVITVDHVIEATAAVDSLLKRNIIGQSEAEPARQAILSKFRSNVIKSTVDPRKLVRLSRAVERGEVSKDVAEAAIRRLVQDENYGIEAAFTDTVEQADFEHSVEQLATRLDGKLREIGRRRYRLSAQLRDSLSSLRAAIDTLINR